MKQQLQKVILQKQQAKKQLDQLNANYIKTIYVGILKNKTYKEIHEELLKTTINQKKRKKATSATLLKTALQETKRLKRSIPKEPIKYVKNNFLAIKNVSSNMLAISIILFSELNFDGLNKSINQELRKIETEAKNKVISDTLKQNRERKEPYVFYLSSQHNDSASDHKDWQGKIYIDKEWRYCVKDEKTIKAIENYIHKNKIYYFQWVIDKPVYFITRPNCRHYFKPLPVSEVINNQTNKLVEKYKMHHEIGKREYVQTLNHKKSKEWSNDKRNVELLLTRYKNRLRIHKMLYKEYENELIEKAIVKDYLLIAKWEKHLRDMK